MKSLQRDTNMESLEPDRDMMMDPSGKLQYFYLNLSLPAHPGTKTGFKLKI